MASVWVSEPFKLGDTAEPTRLQGPDPCVLAAASLWPVAAAQRTHSRVPAVVCCGVAAEPLLRGPCSPQNKVTRSRPPLCPLQAPLPAPVLKRRLHASLHWAPPACKAMLPGFSNCSRPSCEASQTTASKRGGQAGEAFQLQFPGHRTKYDEGWTFRDPLKLLYFLAEWTHMPHHCNYFPSLVFRFLEQKGIKNLIFETFGNICIFFLIKLLK